jgi:hypothetical protein
VLTGQPSLFDTDFADDSRYMTWSVTDIRNFLKEYPELAMKFNNIVNRFLVAQINKLSLYVRTRK